MNYRTLFISDLHIPKKNNIKKLVNFLKHHNFETIYLVGDIFDGTALEISWSWQDDANTLIQLLLRKAHNGTKIIYIFGNHDMFLERFDGFNLGNISITEYAEHTTLKGERILIFHAHQIDIICRYSRFFHILGSRLFNLGTYLSILMNRFKNAFPKIKRLNKYYSFHNIGALEIATFEKNACEVAEQRGFSAVLCGHYHHPDIKKIGNITYYNSGNLCDKSDAIVENNLGELHLISL